MNSIELELLKASHLEHFKAAKDLSFILSIDHPRRKRVEKELNYLTNEIQRSTISTSVKAAK
jgi:hypothetical protein